MSEKQDYYRKLVDLEYGFLIESIQDKSKADSVSDLMSFILALLKLDMSYHKKIKNISNVKKSAEMVEQLTIK